MAYRYQWVWQWDATRHLAGTTEELLANVESQITQKLLSHSEVTSIESIIHSGVEYWTENLGLTRRWKGTTTTVFLSTEASASPIAPIILAIVALVLVAVIAAIIYFIVSTTSSTVTELAEKAPLALTAGALALLGIVAIGGYMLIKERKPIERAVARVVPVAERVGRRAVRELHM